MDEQEFTSLRSDIKAREQLAKLKFENDSDKGAAEVILLQKTWNIKIREWVNIIIAAKGASLETRQKKK